MPFGCVIARATQLPVAISWADVPQSAPTSCRQEQMLDFRGLWKYNFVRNWRLRLYRWWKSSHSTTGMWILLC